VYGGIVHNYVKSIKEFAKIPGKKQKLPQRIVMHLLKSRLTSVSRPLASFAIVPLFTPTFCCLLISISNLYKRTLPTEEVVITLKLSSKRFFSAVSRRKPTLTAGGAGIAGFKVV
jgi:hypothetical protein